MTRFQWFLAIIFVIIAMTATYPQLPGIRENDAFLAAQSEALLQAPTLTEQELNNNANSVVNIDNVRLVDGQYIFTVRTRVFENDRFVRARTAEIILEQEIEPVNFVVVIGVWSIPLLWMVFTTVKSKTKAT